MLLSRLHTKKQCQVLSVRIEAVIQYVHTQGICINFAPFWQYKHINNYIITRKYGRFSLTIYFISARIFTDCNYLYLMIVSSAVYDCKMILLNQTVKYIFVYPRT